MYNESIEVKDFSKLHSLLTQLENKFEIMDNEGNATSTFHLFQEAYVLIEQLDYVLKELKLHDWRGGDWIKTQLLSEMFYYKAFRLLEILKKDFGLSLKHKETRHKLYHITHVRNKLIEHPGQKGGNLIMSFGYRKNSPIIKPVLSRGGRHEQGVLEDISILYDELLKVLRDKE